MEKPEGCDSCGHETHDLKFYEVEWLCKVCASTSAGNASRYPQQYENADILKMLAKCTNMILDAIKSQTVTCNHPEEDKK